MHLMRLGNTTFKSNNNNCNNNNNSDEDDNDTNNNSVLSNATVCIKFSSEDVGIGNLSVATNLVNFFFFLIVLPVFEPSVHSITKGYNY